MLRLALYSDIDLAPWVSARRQVDALLPSKESITAGP